MIIDGSERMKRKQIEENVTRYLVCGVLWLRPIVLSAEVRCVPRVMRGYRRVDNSAVCTHQNL